MKRRSLLRIGLLLPLSVMAGCFGGGGRAPHTWWVLEASGAPGSAEPDPHRAKLSLVVEGVAAGALYDGTALVYSRGTGMRAPYLYASWSERPAVRLARLAQRRLQARGGFRDVTLAEAGVAPDLLLTLTLDRLDHDLVEGGEEPESETGSQDGNGGELALALTATLVDWHARRPIAWRHFSTAEPVATANAASAVAAAGRAAEVVLAELAPWVEAAAAGLAPPASAGARTPDTPSDEPAPVKPAQARGTLAPADEASPGRTPSRRHQRARRPAASGKRATRHDDTAPME